MKPTRPKLCCVIEQNTVRSHIPSKERPGLKKANILKWYFVGNFNLEVVLHTCFHRIPSLSQGTMHRATEGGNDILPSVPGKTLISFVFPQHYTQKKKFHSHTMAARRNIASNLKNPPIFL